MWLDPQTNYSYRDKYRILKNPWRKIEHFWELKKKKDFLKIQGMGDSLSVKDNFHILILITPILFCNISIFYF
jgi:hypothetical protein